MLFFTSKEKAAIVRVALAMGVVDGNADDKETALSALIFIKLGIGEYEMDLAGKLTSEQLKSIISSMTYEEKNFVCSFLAMLIVIDGEITADEIKLWKVMSSKFNFPPMSLQEAIDKFSDYV